MSNDRFVPTGGAVDLSALAQQHEAAARGTDPAAPAPATGEPLAYVDDVVIDGGEEQLQEFMQLSTRMPVLVEMHAKWSSASQELSPVLAEVVRSLGGRTMLLRIDLDAMPQAGQQPQVLALFGGRPMPLFADAPPREQLVALLDELLEVAASQGLDGRVEVETQPGEHAPAPEPEIPLPPLHQEAQDAIGRGDYPAAIDAYERRLVEHPADDEAKAALAQVRLLDRLGGKTLAEVRERGAEHPTDLEAQFDVADVDLSGGHVDDAFRRLLALYPKVDADARTKVRDRLLELFEVVGPEDARVKRARQQLTSLLFA